MEASLLARRVAIAVRPRLLADALVRALDGVDGDIVITLDPPPGSASHFDAAVVMGMLPAGLSADTVIRLPATGDSGPGSITTLRGTESAPLADLPALLETLNHYLFAV